MDRFIESVTAWRLRTVHAVILLAIVGFSAVAQGVDIHDTRLFSQPAISRTHIAFIYAGSLWVADHEGENVEQLTSVEGLASHPAFSEPRKLDRSNRSEVRCFHTSGNLPNQHHGRNQPLQSHSTSKDATPHWLARRFGEIE